MKTIAALGMLLAGSALAGPLLNTKTSFAQSLFCKTYQCQLAGKDVLGPGLSEWRYTIKGEFPVGMDNSPEVVAVLRQNDRMISAHWVSGAQDTVLYPNGYHTRMVAALVGTLTGKTPTQGNLVDLNSGCETSLMQIFTVAWNGRYQLSCLMTEEFQNAWRFSLHVSLP